MLFSVGEMISSTYTNITTGIRDPSVFKVPPQCQGAKFIDQVLLMGPTHKKGTYHICEQ